MPVEVLEIWSRQSDGGDGAQKAWTVKGALSVSHARIADDGTIRIPRRGDVHPTNPGIWAGKPDAKRIGFNLYEVTVTYSNDRGSTSDDTDPLSEPPEYEWSIGLQSVEIDADIDGNPFLNSARSALDQNPTSTVTQIYLTISRNLPYFDVQRAIRFTNSVNNAELAIPMAGTVKEGQVKCLAIVPAGKYTRDSEYITEIARFEIAEFDQSMLRFMDLGFHGVVEDNGEPKDLGDAPAGGFKLNGLGGVLPKQGITGGDNQGSSNVPGFPGPPTGATIEKYPPDAEPPQTVWLKWKNLKKRSFADLGLFNV